MTENKETAKFHWQSLALPGSIIGGIAIVATIITFAINAKEEAKEVKNYKLQPWSVTHCPFPFGLKNTLTRYKPETAWEMAKEINAEMGPKLGYSRPIYAKPGPDTKNHALITLRGSMASERTNGKKCYAPFMGPNSAVSENVMGFLHYKVMEVGNRLIDSTIVMCDLKYKKIKAIVKKPTGLVLHLWKRYVKHELMHPLTGAGHPNWHADVTHASAPHPEVSAGMVKVLKRLYDPVCKTK